ncbi:leucine-rich repeat domain-containing protein [Enterococcus avium]|uniref:leucine-rich repeat domain-containing protein n=1 Tax=Enterococcus avium TaxID=33945 RepID=UPI002891444D|nr:leucine-rich repeat domain-containing protein [Enterococcus avium]MBN2921636.1 leucine-rich repeat protein [Lactobacillus sp.]MDT2481111.1 leucine-rich repeat domain-containing protein [Enterococcus avium]
MTNGTSQGLFIVVAIIIFGIFVFFVYLIFGDNLKGSLTTIFADGLTQTSNNLQSETDLKSYKTDGNTTYVKVNDQLYLALYNDGIGWRVVASAPNETDFTSNGSNLTANSLNLPDKVDGKAIYSINSGLFAGTKFNGMLSLPKYLVTIGDGAFVQSTFSGTFTAPDTLTSIGNSAFTNSNFSGSIDLKNITSIGSQAFENSTFTGKLILPKGYKQLMFDGTFGNSSFSDVDTNGWTGILSKAIRMADGSYYSVN